MFFRHNADKLVYPLVAAILLMWISYRPSYRLRADMPQGFYPAKEPCGSKPPIEQKIACAYWDSAQMNIQFKYPHDHPLPINVSPEFRIDAREFGPVASDEATQQLYWYRLQRVWYIADTWKEEYEWNWSWASDPLNSGGQWLRETFSRLFTIR